MVEVAARKGPPVSVEAVAVPIRTTPKDTIAWKPLGGASPLPFTGTSYVDVRKALIESFGRMPFVLTLDQHGEMLRAMGAVAGEGAAPYHQLHAAIEKFGAIEISES